MADLDADFAFIYDDVIPLIEEARIAANQAVIALHRAQSKDAAQVAKIRAERREWYHVFPYPESLQGMPEDAQEPMEDAHRVASKVWWRIAAACESLREPARRAWQASENTWQAWQATECLAWGTADAWGTAESDARWQAVVSAAEAARAIWEAVEQEGIRLWLEWHQKHGG